MSRNCRLSGSIFLVALLVASCAGGDDSGLPNVQSMRQEAAPFLEKFGGSTRFVDRFEHRSFYVEPREDRIDRRAFVTLAEQEGWRYVDEQNWAEASEIKYGKKRLCLILGTTRGHSVIYVSWSRNTRSWNYCRLE
jgi:hypothetical protein